MLPALRRLLLLYLLLLAITAGAYAQQAAPRTNGGEPRAAGTTGSVGYIFASPNRRVNMTLGEAVRNLNSKEETAIILAARDVACRLGAKAKVSKSVGDWSDGSENSVLVRTAGDEASLRYADAWLGRRFGQKEVLHFLVQPSGASRMYVVRTRRTNLARLSKTLDRGGIAFRTLVRGRHGTTVYVVELSHDLQKLVASAARRLRGRMTVFEGTGEFVGDGDASKAQTIFAGIVGEYESAHPQVTKPCQNRERECRLRNADFGLRIGKQFSSRQSAIRNPHSAITTIPQSSV